MLQRPGGSFGRATEVCAWRRWVRGFDCSVNICTVWGIVLVRRCQNRIQNWSHSASLRRGDVALHEVLLLETVRMIDVHVVEPLLELGHGERSCGGVELEVRVDAVALGD